MTKEEEHLLLIELCEKLPYGVIVDNPNPAGGAWDEVINIDISAKTVTLLYDGRVFSINDVKPYLRPMSSITEEENEIIVNISNNGKGFVEDDDGWIRCDNIHTKWGVWPDGCAKLLDYLNSTHVDYRGLIPMGLALEAPEDMYKTK